MTDLANIFSQSVLPRIRVKAFALIRRPSDGRWLAMYGTDPSKDREFYRPAGGSVEFGESSRDAVCREMMEEFSAVVEPVRLWGTTENIYRYRDEIGHEVVFLWECRFVDESFYSQDELTLIEGDEQLVAHWIDPDDLAARGIALYPDGLPEILRRKTAGSQKFHF